VPPAGKEPLAQYTVVSSHYFRTAEIQLVVGRLFPGNVRLTARLSSSSTKQWLAHFGLSGSDRQTPFPVPRQEELGGSHRRRSRCKLCGRRRAPETRLQAYIPLAREAWGYVTIALRASAPEALAEPLRRVVAELDPDLPVADLRTIRQAVDQSQNYFRLANEVLGGFALLGLLLPRSVSTA